MKKLFGENTTSFVLLAFFLVFVAGWVVYLSYRHDECAQRGGVLVREAFGIGWNCVAMKAPRND